MAPSHHYERLPTIEDEFPRNNSYHTGLPSTAPPSFHSIASERLPHRNDESAATIMPFSERPQLSQERTTQDMRMEEEAISLWPSSSISNRDFNESREDVIVRLTDRVEQLEERLDTLAPNKEQLDPESLSSRRKEMLQRWAVAAPLVLVMVWFMGVIGMAVLTAHKRAGGGKD